MGPIDVSYTIPHYTYQYEGVMEIQENIYHLRSYTARAIVLKYNLQYGPDEQLRERE